MTKIPATSKIQSENFVTCLHTHKMNVGKIVTLSKCFSKLSNGSIKVESGLKYFGTLLDIGKCRV